MECSMPSLARPPATSRSIWDVTTGKVLRLRDDGTIPADNPFVSVATPSPRCSPMDIVIHWDSPCIR